MSRDLNILIANYGMVIFSQSIEKRYKFRKGIMEPIQIFKKTDGPTYWEFLVLLGHEDRDVGFLVKADKQHWEEITNGRYKPERLIQKTFKFLLKKQSKYSILRSFNLREVQRSFPEYEEEMRKGRLLRF